MKTDAAAINQKVLDKDVANQLKEFLKIMKTAQLKSRKVGVIKLTSHYMSLKRIISLVVYTAGHITSYCVNMVRWAGRASLVIMNQEEKVSNTLISEHSNDNNNSVSDSAPGGSKHYKFVLLSEAAIIKPVPA